MSDPQFPQEVMILGGGKLGNDQLGNDFGRSNDQLGTGYII